MTTARQTFPKAVRVRSKRDFANLYDRGVRMSDSCVSLLGMRNDVGFTRVGLSVSKRCGNAVQRNRWKRLIRETFRLSRAQWPIGLDFVVQPRASEPPSLNALRESLTRLVRRLDKKLTGSGSTNRSEAELS